MPTHPILLNELEAAPAAPAPRTPIVGVMPAATGQDGQPIVRWQATWPEHDGELELDPVTSGIGFGATALEAEADLAAWTVFCLPMAERVDEALGSLGSRLDVLSLAAAKVRRTIQKATAAASQMNSTPAASLRATAERWQSTLTRLTAHLDQITEAAASAKAESRG